MAKGRYNACYVIERMEVATLPRAYVLGCGAQRVTVLSQQFRAFNLVWALVAEGRLKAGDRVGVVGGGIGGLTVAAAAMLVGCEVVIAEERSDLMHLQRQNKTRLLHPNIYEWPDPVAEQGTTRFPCLNWSADTAGSVVATLDEEWIRLETKYSPVVKRDTEITAIEVRGSDKQLVMMSENWESKPCDAVILAVGFGVERGTEGLQLETYWETDNLGEPVKGPQRVKRYFVSGLGDGACIDVLRLSYSGFDHTQFVGRLVRVNELLALRTKLLQIELRMPDKGQSEYIHSEYQKLPFPADLAKRFGSLRTDTKVELNGADPFPYSPKACILHRVAIWGLDKAGHLRYRPGTLDVGGIETRPDTHGIKFMVPVPGDGGLTAFNKVILRHGPRPRLPNFSTVFEGYKGIKENPAKDRTRRQIYPDNFYPTPDPVRSGDGEFQPSMVLDARSTGREFGATSVPPLIVESDIESAVAGVTVQTANATSVVVSRVEALARQLAVETRSHNFPDARDTADQLDTLLRTSGERLPSGLWQDAHTSLFDFELLAQARAEAGGESRNTARLRELITRAENGNR